MGMVMLPSAPPDMKIPLAIPLLLSKYCCTVMFPCSRACAGEDQLCCLQYDLHQHQPRPQAPEHGEEEGEPVEAVDGRGQGH